MLRKLFLFSGRASRSEYWKSFGFSVLFVVVVQVTLITAISMILGSEAIRSGKMTVSNLPLGHVLLVSVLIICFLMLSVTARRFQDHGWSGKWFWWMFCLLPVPVFGLLTSIVGFSAESTQIAFIGFGVGLVSVSPIYASVVWTFWIGFMRGESGPNRYGPNTTSALNSVIPTKVGTQN